MNGKIMYYEVKDEHNSYYTVTPQDLKNKLREPGVTCTNLKLTSNGRLISSGSSNMFSKLNLTCSGSDVDDIIKALQKNIKIPIKLIPGDDGGLNYYSCGHLIMIIEYDIQMQYDEYGDEYTFAIDMPLPTNEIDMNLLRNYTIENGVVQSKYNNNNREMLADLCEVYNTYAIKSTDILEYGTMCLITGKTLRKSIEDLKCIGNGSTYELWVDCGGPFRAENLGGWSCQTWTICTNEALVKLTSHVWGYEIVIEDDKIRFKQSLSITRGSVDKRKVTAEMYNFFRRTLAGFVRIRNNMYK